MNEQEEQWITGFAEGDGTVLIDNWNLPRVVFSQKEHDILDYISTLVPNGHISNFKPKYSTICYQLCYNGAFCTELLTTFSRYVVSKHFLQRLNKVLTVVGLPLTTKHTPTLDWITGFWDADGSSQNALAGLNIMIEQKQRDVLDALQKTFGGSVCQNKPTNAFRKGGTYYQWQIYCTTARELFATLLERSHNTTKAENLLRHTREHEQEVRTREYIKQHPEEVERLREKYNLARTEHA